MKRRDVVLTQGVQNGSALGNCPGAAAHEGQK